MPHVSSRKLDEKTSNEIYKILIETIASKNVSKKLHKDFFNELLTKTEKVMFGKRLAAIDLLSRGASPYRTGKLLGLSATTTNKILLKIEKGRFDKTIKMCEMYRKGPLGRYLENLFKPLPRYGTSLSSLFKE